MNNNDYKRSASSEKPNPAKQKFFEQKTSEIFRDKVTVFKETYDEYVTIESKGDYKKAELILKLKEIGLYKYLRNGYSLRHNGGWSYDLYQYNFGGNVILAIDFICKKYNYVEG